MTDSAFTRLLPAGSVGYKLSFLLVTILLLIGFAHGQTCASGDELDASTKAAVDGAARQYFDMSAHGDVAGLKANAIPAISGDFSAIEQAVISNKEFLSEGQPTIAGTHVLDASQSKGTLARADFYCGIYNSPDRVGFSIPNLPPGRYAIVIQKVEGKDPITLTMILQEVGNSWELAGYYLHLNSIGGHDGDWFVAQARAYKAKGQLHNAWLYYLTGWDLLAPVNFMSTPTLDKLADEMQSARPGDLPSQDKPLSLQAGGKTFPVTEITAVPVENALDLRVVYDSPDASNSGTAFQDNMAVIKAIIAKYPEYRDAFNAVVARAVDKNGHNYGSLQPMKEVK